MAKVVYKSYNQNDNLLFPHCIGDFIPENDPVRVLDAIVEHLDISAIEATYKGGGASSFAPRMLLKVILVFLHQLISSHFDLRERKEFLSEILQRCSDVVDRVIDDQKAVVDIVGL